MSNYWRTQYRPGFMNLGQLEQERGVIMKTILSQVEISQRPTTLWEDLDKAKGMLVGISISFIVWSGFVYWLFR